MPPTLATRIPTTSPPTTLTLAVECSEAGSTITLYADGVAVGTRTHTCTAVGSEEATVEAPGLTAFARNITYTDTDVHGNESDPRDPPPQRTPDAQRQGREGR